MAQRRSLLLAAVALLAASSSVSALQYQNLDMALSPAHMSYFRAVAIAAGYSDLLADRDWKGTAFLPSNEGFEFMFYYWQTTLPKLLEDKELCKMVTEYHLVPNRIIRVGDVPALNAGSIVVPTMLDDDALMLGKVEAFLTPHDVNGVAKSVTYVKGYVNQATVKPKGVDQHTPAGIVQLINSALVPNMPIEPLFLQGATPQTIASIIKATPVLSDLWVMIQKAGLESYFESLGLQTTMFAPDNEAIHKLLTKLGYSTLEQLWAKGAAYLHGLIADFTLPQRVLVEDLTDLAVYPTNGGYEIIVYNVGGVISIGSPRDVATVISKPLYVDPSAVYIVDRVLLEKPTHAEA